MKWLKNLIKASLQRILILAQRSYHFAKFCYMYKKARELKGLSGSPLIIIQMGKVGSKSVKRTLDALDLDMPIYHSHLLTKARIAETEKKRKKFFRTSRESYLKRPWLNQFLRTQIDKGLVDKKWKLITLTRDPVARNLSTFFENLEVRLLNDNDEFVIESDYYDIHALTVTSDDVQVLTELFHDRVKHDSPLEFFDRELKGVFGVDVYGSEFPKSKGYKIYNDKIADVLLIRLEDLDYRAPEAFKEFLDIDNFILKHENIGSNKNYSAIYARFKREIYLSETYLDKFYNSKYMRHFYTEEEINTLREKWFR